MPTDNRWTDFLASTLEQRTEALDARSADHWRAFRARTALALLHGELLTASDSLRSQFAQTLTVTDTGDGLMVGHRARIGFITRDSNRVTLKAGTFGGKTRAEEPPDLPQLKAWAHELAQWLVKQLLAA